MQDPQSRASGLFFNFPNIFPEKRIFNVCFSACIVAYLLIVLIYFFDWHKRRVKDFFFSIKVGRQGQSDSAKPAEESGSRLKHLTRRKSNCIMQFQDQIMKLHNI